MNTTTTIKTVRAYMCVVDWLHEFAEGAAGPYSIYDNLDECREKCPCCSECGIMELEIKEIGYAQKPRSFSTKTKKLTKKTKKVKTSVKNNKKRKA